jgi:hypothetical protein
VLLNTARGENVVLYLKNGDKITGFVVSEYTNRVVLSNSWAKDLSVPLSEIKKREITGMVATVTNTPEPTNFLARLRSNLRNTNAEVPPLFKHWKGQAEVGVDLTYSTIQQQLYHGSFNLSYEHPYPSNPKLFFRNTTDFLAEYGKTEQTVKTTNSLGQTVSTPVEVISANQIGGSDKTSFDLTRRWYVFNLGGAGYDQIRGIKLHVEDGPGAGYHLLTGTNLNMNLEAGANYQIQNRTDDTRIRDVFFRLAENVNWKLTPRTTFTEAFEFYPRVNFEEYRARLEATLSYNLWRYVYLNLSVRDNYDTDPVPGTSANELLAHSALGLKF